MPVSGNLNELGPVELLQFPVNGSKTGRLVVKGARGSGEFGYESGRLVYAVCDGLSGDDAVVAFVSWTEGTFEFRLDERPSGENVNTNLYRLIMVALARRDEEAARVAERREASVAVAEKTRGLFVGFIAANASIAYVALVDEDGDVTADASRNDPPPGSKQVASVLAGLAARYPRAGTRRIMVEEPQGIAIVARVGDAGFVMAIASEGTAPGNALFAVSKLAASVAESLGE